MTFFRIFIKRAENLYVRNFNNNCFVFCLSSCTYLQVCNHPFLFGEPRDENGVFLSELNNNMLVRS